MSFIEAIWDVLLELAPWLLLGALVSALLHKWLPPDFMQRNLRGRGAVAKAVLFGVPLPLCSCGVIPAGIGLKKDGASDGASIGFLIATPQTGVDSIFVAGSFLGWPFALFKVAAAAATGLVGGWLTDRFGSTGTDEAPPTHDSGDRTWRGAFDHGLQIIRGIWGWLAFGVVASAAITVLVPNEWLAALGDYGGLPAMFVVLLIAVPLYVCATASVPIAASLVAGGMPAGAALVFLMAGPATNIATLGAIKKTFGLRTTAIYLVTILVGSIGLGWAFGFLIEATTAPAHEHGAAWWATASAVALTAMLCWFAVGDLRRKLTSPGAKALEIGVEGMTCGGCARRLERVLNNTDGVDGATVSIETNTAHVEGEVDESVVRAAIAAAGFDAV
ncbi:MAG TPA: permease [Myxococcota bacterium]|nr:permease [Myxococcota bacterium]